MGRCTCTSCLSMACDTVVGCVTTHSANKQRGTQGDGAMPCVTYGILVALCMLCTLPALCNAHIYAQANSSHTPGNTQVSLDHITAVIQHAFGPKVQVLPAMLAHFYLLGDFNGDGQTDLAVIVKPEQAKADLRQYHVRFMSIDPYSVTNGHRVDPVAHMNSHNNACLGVALIHGRTEGWQTPNPMEKYMFYACFSDFRLLRKGQKIRRGRGSVGPTPVTRGDAIQLDME